MSTIAIGPLSYAELAAPSGYACGCGAHGVKLWRDYNTFLDHQTLRCAACAIKYGKAAGPVDDEGRVPFHGARIDQINGLVPAVPTAEGDTFWGYSAVPTAGVAWWRALPTHDAAEPVEARMRRMVAVYAESAATWEDLYKRRSESANVAEGRAFALASLLRDVSPMIARNVAKLREIRPNAWGTTDEERGAVRRALGALEFLSARLHRDTEDPREARNDELAQTRADAVALDEDADQMARALDKVRAAADSSERGWLAKVNEALADSRNATDRAKERRAAHDFLRPGAEMVRELKEILACLRERPEPYVEQAERRLAAVIGKGGAS